ncbi:MAG TPA: glutathione synthase [Polyangiales bacterium]
MRFLFVMDPPSVVKFDSDTSFALMLEAQAQGHRVDHCLPTDLFLVSGTLHAHVRRASLQRDPIEPIQLAQGEDVNLESVDAVFVRTDPPFDTNYLWTTLMLERLRGKTLVINDPRGLRDANEKLYATQFPELMPDTMVTSHRERIRSFLKQLGGKAVIKPVDGAGGRGVMALSEGDPNLRAIIDTVTEAGRRLAMVQRFLPAYKQGDKRILLLDGEPIGAVLRVPRSDDIASNLAMGGTAAKAEVDDADRRIIARLAPALRRDGLYFVGLDVIGGMLTEVNVTSPTGIQQIMRLNNENVPARVIEWVVQKASSLKPH